MNMLEFFQSIQAGKVDTSLCLAKIEDGDKVTPLDIEVTTCESEGWCAVTLVDLAHHKTRSLSVVKDAEFPITDVIYKGRSENESCSIHFIEDGVLHFETRWKELKKVSGL